MSMFEGRQNKVTRNKKWLRYIQYYSTNNWKCLLCMCWRKNTRQV